MSCMEEVQSVVRGHGIAISVGIGYAVCGLENPTDRLTA